jgi:hypothetical protein
MEIRRSTRASIVGFPTGCDTSDESSLVSSPKTLTSKGQRCRVQSSCRSFGLPFSRVTVRSSCRSVELSFNRFGRSVRSSLAQSPHGARRRANYSTHTPNSSVLPSRLLFHQSHQVRPTLWRPDAHLPTRPSPPILFLLCRREHQTNIGSRQSRRRILLGAPQSM